MILKLILVIVVLFVFAPAVPPDESHAKGALEKSPRHREWVEVKVPGGDRVVKCYVAYPERGDKAPVVIVIHEIFGATEWIFGVTDQLAADGFIAIAPDLLTEKGPDGGDSDSFKSREDVMKAVRDLKPEVVMSDLDSVRDFATQLPAANGKSATIGFCWGGGISFAYAAHQPKLDAAVVYYGVPPEKSAMEKIAAPVMGFYGGDDARITATVKPTEESMKGLKKSYVAHVFDGAGHGFLRQQDGKAGANQKAADAAWPATIEFLNHSTQ